ncbi:hypothetical protein TNCV_4547601 [Trichonephila clavipes]|nr:hypothetical protein TNCV_4547601 [Trichonephila clavipes]
MRRTWVEGKSARTDDDGHFSKSAKDAPQRSSVSWTLVGSPYHGFIFPAMDSCRISVPWTYLPSDGLLSDLRTMDLSSQSWTLVGSPYHGRILPVTRTIVNVCVWCNGDTSRMNILI